MLFLLTSVSVYHVETLYTILNPGGHCCGCRHGGHHAPHPKSGCMQIVHCHFITVLSFLFERCKYKNYFLQSITNLVFFERNSKNYSFNSRNKTKRSKKNRLSQAFLL